MDAVLNPFAPGAGSRPPELAGRDDLIETVRVAVERVRRGLPTKSVLMVGLRGVGKTVLLDRMRDDAEAGGIQTVRIKAPKGRSLPALLSPELRVALLTLSRNEQAKDLARRALRGLAGFAKALKVKYSDIEVGLDFEPEPGLADNEELEHDLQALLEAGAAAAQKAGTALALFVDELQYVEEGQLAALITALHRASQRRLQVVLVGAGLPQLRGPMGPRSCGRPAPTARPAGDAETHDERSDECRQLAFFHILRFIHKESQCCAGLLGRRRSGLQQRLQSCSESPLSAKPGSGSKSSPTSMSEYFTFSAFAKPARPRSARRAKSFAC